MAPPQRHPSPAKQMVELGRTARLEGLTFEEFWERAVRPGASPPMTTRRVQLAAERPDVEIPFGAIIWPSDTAERTDSQAATAEAKDVWRRAYDQEEATRGELALSALYAMLTEVDTGGMQVGSDVPLAATL